VAEADPNNARAQVGVAVDNNQLGLMLAKAGKPGELQHELRALEIRKKLAAADPKNRGRQEAIAISYETLGDTEEILASRPNLPSGQRRRHWRGARSWYQQALQGLNALRSQSALRGGNASEPDRVAREIEKCDTMLRKLGEPSDARIK
jgi:hypothetical protein